MKRRLLVNLGLILVLALIGWLCFDTGKAYKVVFENVPYTVDGVEQPAIEAIQVTLDKQNKPIYLLADDRLVGTAVGHTHTLFLELLDEEDKPIEHKTIHFSTLELNEKLELNVAKVWTTGKP